VYIAVDNSHRGKGYGKQLMQKPFQLKGNIALHVEPDNPKKIIRKLGFTNKYLECVSSNNPKWKI
jgi:ribosomal protein S18 acetylase RimI-like enzyme